MAARAMDRSHEATTNASLSERVQGLIQSYDPWEGSGVGPTRWSQPFCVDILSARKLSASVLLAEAINATYRIQPTSSEQHDIFHCRALSRLRAELSGF